MSKDRNVYVNTKITMKTIEQLDAEAKKARQDANDAGGTDESLNKLAEDAEKALADAKNEDVDYNKRLEDLNNNLPPDPNQRSEKDKAKFTIDKILERHPELKDEMGLNGKPIDDKGAEALEAKLLRNQVEGIIRQNSKSESEVKYKMHFYDHRIVKTGNIHEDADNAVWLSNKERTRNAITEMQRNPGDPGAGAGAGGRPPLDSIPSLSPDQVRRLTQAGLKQTAPGRWEGTKVVVEYDKVSKQWVETFK